MKHKNTINQLRKYRKMRSLTQVQVARILGLHDHNRLSNWERGRCFPTVKALFRLAAIYRTVPHELYLDMQTQTTEEIIQRESEILKTAKVLEADKKARLEALPKTDYHNVVEKCV